MIVGSKRFLPYKVDLRRKSGFEAKRVVCGNYAVNVIINLMLAPRFTITNQILINVGKIEAAREVIENSPLVPAWEEKFREEAMVRAAHFGTHLEGNDLTLT